MGKSLDIIDLKKDMDIPEENDSREDEFKGEPNGSGGVFYLVLGIIALVVAIAVALYILYKDNKTQTNTTETPITETQTSLLSPTTTITSSVTLTTPTAISPQASFKYTNEKIRIANGNGINGEATKIKGGLVDAGFKVASTGNASKSYSETIIYYKAGQQALGEALKTAIKDSYSASIKEDNAVVGSYDAVIALGAK